MPSRLQPTDRRGDPSVELRCEVKTGRGDRLRARDAEREAYEASQAVPGAKAKDVAAAGRALRQKKKSPKGNEHERAAVETAKRAERRRDALLHALDEDAGELADFLARHREQLLAEARAQVAESCADCLQGLAEQDRRHRALGAALAVEAFVDNFPAVKATAAWFHYDEPTRRRNGDELTFEAARAALAAVSKRIAAGKPRERPVPAPTGEQREAARIARELEQMGEALKAGWAAVLSCRLPSGETAHEP